MSAKTQAKAEVAEAAPVEEISLEDFLKGVDASATLKAMFTHYSGKNGEPAKATKEAFESAFEAFRELPASKL